MISRVRESFGVDLPLRLLFERPTVEALAAAIEAARDAGSRPEAPPLVPVARGGELPLSFAQQRLWFLERFQPGTPTYNMPSAVRFRGALAAAVLRRCLREEVRRHEVAAHHLRRGSGRAGAAGGRGAQAGLPWSTCGGPRRRRARGRSAASPPRSPAAFDLGAGPLIRATLLRAGERPRALLTMHHIVSDGWSMGADPRAGALSGLPRRRAVAAPRAGDAVRRLRGLAARLDARRGAGNAARLLAASGSPGMPSCSSPPTVRGRRSSASGAPTSRSPSAAR